MPVVGHVAVAPPGNHVELAATWPQADWLTDEARRRLRAMPWRVTDRLDRTGVRLAGEDLRWRSPEPSWLAKAWSQNDPGAAVGAP